MAISVRGKNVDITLALKEYVEKRLKKIIRYFENEADITVILAVEKGRHIVEVTVSVSGVLLRGEESTSDMYTSVDKVVEKLEKQIEKYKTRLSKKFRAGLNKSVVDDNEADEFEVEDVGDVRVVKTKRFAIKPMDVQEAIMQMNLINHDFYVFTNAQTEDVSVVYRRRDGNYGLIEAE